MTGRIREKISGTLQEKSFSPDTGRGMITMWNGSIVLPRVKETGQDKEGFDTHENITWEGGIPANFTDATRNDEILAFQKGYSADRNIETMACNYRGEGDAKG